MKKYTLLAMLIISGVIILSGCSTESYEVTVNGKKMSLKKAYEIKLSEFEKDIEEKKAERKQDEKADSFGLDEKSIEEMKKGMKALNEKSNKEKATACW